MELTENPSDSESFFSRDGAMEAIDLLEECWFFDNLLNTKPKMPRCYSDVGPSTGLTQNELKISDCSRIMSSTTQAQKSGSSRSKLMRAPSMPPCRVLEEEKQKMFAELKGLQKKEFSSKPSKLHRTPSLPPRIGREETIMATGRLSRTSKVPRCRPPKSSELDQTESLSTDGFKEMRRRYSNKGKTKKSLNELECEEVRGFKDLGFSFEKEALDPSVVSILPGLQDKRGDSYEDEAVGVRRPYLSEAWLVQSCAPSIPKWDSKKSPENLKSNIRFWARTVASNVWQEC